jgi:hypothetical protein
MTDTATLPPLTAEARPLQQSRPWQSITVADLDEAEDWLDKVRAFGYRESQVLAAGRGRFRVMWR